MYLLRSFNEAHREICKEDPNGVNITKKKKPFTFCSLFLFSFFKKYEPGSTTLLAGITLEIQGAPRCPNDWAFVCASVGDCKAFLIEHDTLKVIIIHFSFSFEILTFYL